MKKDKKIEKVKKLTKEDYVEMFEDVKKILEAFIEVFGGDKKIELDVNDFNLHNEWDKKMEENKK